MSSDKRRMVLLAGTINHRQNTDEEVYIHLDASPRPIYDAELNMMLAPDIVANIADELPMLPDEHFDEVRLHHVLEHMTHNQTTIALAAIFRVLKYGGTLDVECPDMTRIAEAWLDPHYTHEELQQWLYGEDLGGEFDIHRQAIDAESLRTFVEGAGFKIDDQPETGLAVRYIARKR